MKANLPVSSVKNGAWRAPDIRGTINGEHSKGRRSKPSQMHQKKSSDHIRPLPSSIQVDHGTSAVPIVMVLVVLVYQAFNMATSTVLYSQLYGRRHFIQNLSFLFKKVRLSIMVESH